MDQNPIGFSFEKSENAKSPQAAVDLLSSLKNE